MRNTKEIKALLTAIFCINQTGNKDEDIQKICDYAFLRIFNSTTNLLLMTCLQKTKEEFMPEIKQLLKEETQYTEDKNNE